MKAKLFLVLALAGVVFLGTCSMLKAKDDPPELELILALDWSGSMYYSSDHRRSIQHWEIQRDGHIAALRDQVIANALLRDQAFVRVILWAGDFKEIIELYADQIKSKNNLEALTYALARVPSRAALDNSTNHSAVLAWVSKTTPVGRRRVLDISTDEGITAPRLFEPSRHYLRQLVHPPEGRIQTTVNVLAVAVAPENLKTLYENVRSPDGFVHAIDNWSDYAAAIRRKLLMEIAQR